MLSTKKLIYNILQCSHVVEQGTSSNWTYRKWSDGTAECWGLAVSGSAAFASVGNVFYRTIDNLALPSGLFINTPRIVLSIEMANLGGSSLTASSATSFSVGVISATSAARSITLYAHAIGRWK